MKKRKLYTAEIPAVSNDFAQAMNRRFARIEVKPGVTADELQYNAGQRDVVEFILKVSTGTIVSGDVKDVRPDKNSKSLLQKLLGNY